MAPIWRPCSGFAAAATLHARYASMIHGGAHMEGAGHGPEGTTVLLTDASVQQPVRPFDDDDDRSLIENRCTEEAKQPCELGHPPQKSERAVRVGCMWSLPCSCLPWPRRIWDVSSRRVLAPDRSEAQRSMGRDRRPLGRFRKVWAAIACVNAMLESKCIT
jgi:hypothetical protein